MQCNEFELAKKLIDYWAKAKVYTGLLEIATNCKLGDYEYGKNCEAPLKSLVEFDPLPVIEFPDLKVDMTASDTAGGSGGGGVSTASKTSPSIQYHAAVARNDFNLALDMMQWSAVHSKLEAEMKLLKQMTLSGGVTDENVNRCCQIKIALDTYPTNIEDYGDYCLSHCAECEHRYCEKEHQCKTKSLRQIVGVVCGSKRNAGVDEDVKQSVCCMCSCWTSFSMKKKVRLGMSALEV
jgi:hypothetical protein